MNGLLAGDPAQWVETTNELLADQRKRRRIGTKARRDALLEFAPARQARRYRSILESIEPRSDAGSSWTAETTDEPPRPFELEPYPPPSAREPSGRRAEGPD